MKRIRLGILVALMLLLLTAAGLLSRFYLDFRSLQSEFAVKEWLVMANLPRFELHCHSLPEAVTALNRSINSQPGHPAGLHIAIGSKRDFDRCYHRLEIGSAEPARANPSPISDFDISRTGYTIDDAIRFVATISDLNPRVEGRTILLLPRTSSGTTDRLLPVTLRIPPSPLGFPSSDQCTNWLDCRKFLTDRGLTFHEGSYARYQPSTGTLRIRLADKEYDKLGHIEPPAPGRWPSWINLEDWLYEHLHLTSR